MQNAYRQIWNAFTYYFSEVVIFFN